MSLSDELNRKSKGVNEAENRQRVAYDAQVRSEDLQQINKIRNDALELALSEFHDKIRQGETASVTRIENYSEADRGLLAKYKDYVYLYLVERLLKKGFNAYFFNVEVYCPILGIGDGHCITIILAKQDHNYSATSERDVLAAMMVGTLQLSIAESKFMAELGAGLSTTRVSFQGRPDFDFKVLKKHNKKIKKYLTQELFKLGFKKVLVEVRSDFIHGYSITASSVWMDL